MGKVKTLKVVITLRNGIRVVVTDKSDKRLIQMFEEASKYNK